MYIYTYIYYIISYESLSLSIYIYVHIHTPSPPTESFPTKSPRVELSGRLPIQFDGHENSHP